MADTLIIDYGAGNLRSVLNSLRHISDESDHILLASNASSLKTADRVILPGVGSFHECKRGLEDSVDMIDALNDFIKTGKPFLGICVGMQLLVESGEEHGIITAGLGWLQGQVKRIKPASDDTKIPHMGWNNLQLSRPHPVFEGTDKNDVYFVHSYSVQDAKSEEVIASVDYDGDVVAAIGRDNILGLQFHPEKSQTTGLKILENFMNWRP